ncbi:hypothetical protein IAR55_002199 [Kwoniella newhampshirensis]|uniref:SH3 domain-containing protein n=1 Tax=Kwoniella newhampshirensis TaxID=1651941 RepID=A0AAW0YQ84_9TREE
MIKTSRLGWRREGIGPPGLMVEDEFEAGPSRIPMDGERKNEEKQAECGACERQRRRRQQRQDATINSKTSSNRSHGSGPSLIRLIPPFLLPFMPVTSAVPAPPPASHRPNPPSPSITTSPTPTDPSLVRLDSRGVHYLTSVVTPSVLPTSVTEVDETALPYLLTQHSDGKWRKADGGWFLYGRRVASPTGTTNPVLAENGTDTDSTAEAAPTYAVKETLPNGWGSASSRTSIYKVPLIAVASVIMALAIVALIIFVVLRRRKRHRRAKRAKERLRRKALAAAGLKEDEINGSAAEAIFKEKLAELEKQHLAKKKKGGQAGIARTKVKGWNSKLRRRKGKKGNGEGDEQEGTIEVIPEGQEETEQEVHGIVNASPVEVGDGQSREEASTTARSSPLIGAGLNGSSTPTPVAEQAPSSIIDRNTTTTENIVTSPNPMLPTSYFPPAYRPASVRSFAVGRPSTTTAPTAGPSRSTVQMAAQGAAAEQSHILNGTEKTQAPGYYPAPATEDGEVALAIASRRDGKARVIDAPQEDDEADHEARARMAHVATDDKRVLEQLRLGASAPPALRVDHEQETDSGEQGQASAPEVQVDEQGFEMVNHEEREVTPGRTPTPYDSAFPPPPPKIVTRHSDVDDNYSPSPSVMVNESHLLPSAPPILGDVAAPSAPPGLDVEDDYDIPNAAVPSAPPLAFDEDAVEEEGGSASLGRSDLDNDQPLTDSPEPQLSSLEETEGDDDRSEDHESRRDSGMSLGLGVSGALPPRNGNGNGVLFLPRYEP